MKFLFDLFPVILFFAMFRWGQGHPDAALTAAQHALAGLVSDGKVDITQAPIMLATAVAILATVAQIGYLLARRKKVDTMLWVSMVIITLFGGATIYFHNATFIMWKPTVLYWCFSVGLLVSQTMLGKNLIRLMLEQQVTLPDFVWQRLSLAWALFFGVMGLINLYVAYNFSQTAWVDFKLFGFTGLMIAFVIGQSLFLSKYLKDPQ